MSKKLFFILISLSLFISGIAQTSSHLFRPLGKANNMIRPDVFTGETIDVFQIVESGKPVVLYFSRPSRCGDGNGVYYRDDMIRIKRIKDYFGDLISVIFIEEFMPTTDDFLHIHIKDKAADYFINIPHYEQTEPRDWNYCGPSFEIHFIDIHFNKYRINNYLAIDACSEILKFSQLIVKPIIYLEDCDNSYISLDVQGLLFNQYSYKWSNGAVTKDIYNLAPGFYHVTITDPNGLSKVLGPWKIDLKENSLDVNKVKITHNSCYQESLGEVELEVTGGIPNYTYQWSNGSKEKNINGLKAGVYTVSITDQKACKIIRSFTITQPSSLSFTPWIENEHCDDKNGKIIIEAKGGTPPYKYFVNNVEYLSNEFNNLSHGKYEIRIIDSNYCEYINNLDLVNVPKIKLNLNSTNINECFFEDLKLNAGSLNSSNYNWQWSTKNGEIISDPNSPSVRISKPGNYTVIVANKDGTCENIQTIQVNENQPLVPNFRYERNNNEIWFFDETKGVVLKRKWFLESSINSFEKDPKHVFDYGNEYLVCLEVENECSIKRICKSILIENSSVFKISDVAITHLECKGGTTGSIEIQCQGGIYPYTYKWSTGEKTNSIDQLSAGTYKVTITDLDYSTITREYSVVEPDEIRIKDVKISHTEFNIKKGSIHLDVEGGMPGYFYKWSNGLKGSTIENLSPGSYFVTVSDINYCEKVLGPFEVQATTQNKKLNSSNDISVYPNPVIDELVFGNLTQNMNYKVTITNLLGSTVHNFSFLANSEMEKIKINELKAGIYQLIISQDKVLKVNKIMKL